MSRLVSVVVVMCLASACGGSSAGGGEEAGGGGDFDSDSGGLTSGGEQAAGEGGDDGDDDGPNEFQLSRSDDAESARGERPSQIVANETHAAMRLFVVDRDDGPIQGTVVKMTGPDGTAYYTEETDSQGYAEVLVPVGQRYEVEYLSLGRRNTTAAVQVPPGPRQDIRLTMRYRRWRPPPPSGERPGTVLDGVLFDTNRATLREESHARLDRVAEYMRHRPNVRIRVEGHTDNVGNTRRNQRLSEQRAESVRRYLVAAGIDASRVEAVGHGASRPVASNDTEEGRAQNRRIEAIEL